MRSSTLRSRPSPGPARATADDSTQSFLQTTGPFDRRAGALDRSRTRSFLAPAPDDSADTASLRTHVRVDRKARPTEHASIGQLSASVAKEISRLRAAIDEDAAQRVQGARTSPRRGARRLGRPADNGDEGEEGVSSSGSTGGGGGDDRADAGHSDECSASDSVLAALQGNNHHAHQAAELARLSGELGAASDEIEHQRIVIERQRVELVQREDELARLRAVFAEQEAAVDSRDRTLDVRAGERRDLLMRLGAAEKALRERAEAETDRVLLEDLARQLRSDNERMLRMLCATSEFAHFLEYVEDSKGITYVRPGGEEEALLLARAYGGGGGGGERGAWAADRTAVGPNETLNWVPEAAAHTAAAFRRQHMPSVDEAVIGELLLQLNKVWAEREDSHVKRVQAAHEAERARLLDKLANARPYDDVLVDQKIATLRKQLKQARAQAARKSNAREPVGAQQLLASALAKVEALTLRVAQLETEKAELAKMLHSLDSATVRSSSGTFLKGVTWLGTSFIDRADRLQEDLAEHVLRYQEDSLQLNRADRDYHLKAIRLQSIFVERLDSTLRAFRLALRDVFEKALDASEKRVPFAPTAAGPAGRERAAARP